MPDFKFINNFVPNHEQIFDTVLNETDWDERMKARKTASFGIAYNYSQIAYKDSVFPNWLEDLRKRFPEHIGFLPNNCLLNYYQDGNSSMGFHSDTAAGRTQNTGVAIISLGAAREMVFKGKRNQNKTSTRLLTPGSLIYLDDATQEKWLHAIPKAAQAGPRISLSFRSIA